VGTALMARILRSLDAAAALTEAGRLTDATTVLRSLYEHVVHFAWLAAEPSAARIEEWRRLDLLQRLKADDDCASVGHPLFEPEARQAMETQLAEMTGRDLDLAAIATAADKAWAGKVRGLDAHTEAGSFRGLYAIVYRGYSATAHPGYRSIHPVVDELPTGGQHVHLDDSETHRSNLGMGCVLVAFALAIARESLGWDVSDEALDAIFATYS
jgi:hypothetical protein